MTKCILVADDSTRMRKQSPRFTRFLPEQPAVQLGCKSILSVKFRYRHIVFARFVGIT